MDSILLLIAPASVKAALYFASLFGAGALFFALCFQTNSQRSGFDIQKACRLFGIIGLAAWLVHFLFLSVALEGSIQGLWSLDMLGFLWQSKAGDRLVLGLMGFVLLIGLASIVESWANKTFGKILLLVAGCVILLPLTISGHVSQLEHGSAGLALWIHLIFGSLWVGVLWPLHSLLREGEREAAAQLAKKFGTYAMAFVPLLLFAGGWMAYTLLGSAQAFISTAYGLTLLAKLLCVLALLGVAAINKLLLAPALFAGSERAAYWLKLCLKLELGLFLSLFLVTAWLTDSVPPVNP